MGAPSFMYEHWLEAKKGWFQPSSLDFVAKLSPNVTFDLPMGRVVHVNSAGAFETGAGQTDMPIYIRQPSDAADVSNPGTTVSGLFMHQAVAPSGWMSGLVATGGYELSTTEYDQSRNYAPGDLLTAPVANTNAVTGGRLTNAGAGSHGNVQQYVDPVCGVVSTGAAKDALQLPQLSFWSYFLPGAYS